MPRRRPASALVADAARPEGSGVSADLVECARERLDVGLGEVAGEVLLDRVSVVEAGLVDLGARGVRKLDLHAAAAVSYSWMRPPRRSRRLT
jgi:hypothetical protein